MAGSHVPRVGDRLARSALRVSIAISPAGAAAIIVVGMAASWVLTHLLGGANGVVPHFYYLPIVFAAVRFGPVAALMVALGSGLLAGPLTYLDVDAGTAQSFSRWGTRAGFFVVVGVAMSSMVRPSLSSVVDELRRARSDKRLRQALADGELFLRYQPIVHVRSGKVRGVEALIRWQHPTQGELPPGAFLPAAEESDVIHELGTFVIRTACEQEASWQRVHGVADAPVVSINASARELEDPTLVDRVRTCLEANELNPTLLCVEITESTLVRDRDVTAAQLHALKALGVRIAVDDFGTGYSSLATVHRFPLDFLKVDRSFITPIGEDEITEEVLWGLVVLARSLGLTTVAEGIETQAQDRVIAELGYHLAQGFHYARPLRAGEIDDLLRAGASLRHPDDVRPRLPRIDGPARPRGGDEPVTRRR